MRKLLLVIIFGLAIIGIAYGLTITQTDEWNGFDYENYVTVTFGTTPAGSVITNTTVTASIVTAYNGLYEPDYYAMHLTIGGTTHYNLPNIINVSFSDLNGQSVNGQVITLFSEDIDYIPDWVTLSLSVTITYTPPGGPTPDAPVVNIERQSAGLVKLSWNDVPNATSYYVYAASTPNEEFDYLAGPIEETEYQMFSLPRWKFFKVTASTDPP
jgi:hypothetical protein